LENGVPALNLNVEYAFWDDVGKTLLKYGCDNGFVYELGQLMEEWLVFLFIVIRVVLVFLKKKS
jgi:hypothetical protein